MSMLESLLLDKKFRKKFYSRSVIENHSGRVKAGRI